MTAWYFETHRLSYAAFVSAAHLLALTAKRDETRPFAIALIHMWLAERTH